MTGPFHAPRTREPAPMRDQDTTLAQLTDLLRRFNAERDWGRYHSPRNLAMALSVEAGELLELYLWAADDGPQPPVSSRQPKVADEAADESSQKSSMSSIPFASLATFSFTATPVLRPLTPILAANDLRTEPRPRTVRRRRAPSALVIASSR